MEEILLTSEEINFVNRQAEFSILNNSGFLVKFSKSRHDIFSITPNKKIIFIQGDNFTGLKHINLRHSFYTNAHSKI